MLMPTIFNFDVWGNACYFAFRSLQYIQTLTCAFQIERTSVLNTLVLDSKIVSYLLKW